MSAILPERPPLADVIVLDLTRALSGPFCTMMLGDMGARVIKIERPGHGDDTRAWGPPFQEGESTYFLMVNRNKESVTLDFQREEGRETLERLIARADVLVENFRPGALAPVRLDYPSLSTAHPRLIYASISGYGQTGPRATEPGYDAVVQGEGGLMSLTGDAEGPPFRLGVAVADLVSGLFTCQGILLALLARGRTGRGQHVDVAMLDAVVSMLTYQAGIWFATGEVPGRSGNRHPSIAPYDTFPTADGDLVLAVGTDGHFRALCGVLGLPDLADQPRFATNAARVAHHAELRALLAARLATRPRGDWMAALAAARVPAGSVRDVGEVLADPQLDARDMLERVMHRLVGSLPQLGIPIKLSETPGSIRRPPPTLGEHTDGILSELGLEPSDVAALRGAGIC